MKVSGSSASLIIKCLEALCKSMQKKGDNLFYSISYVIFIILVDSKQLRVGVNSDHVVYELYEG